MHIMDSDAFLDMPPTAQNLYMHMAMRADDDGFVSNPKKISRMIGCGDDDMKVLLGKRFIIPFESGVCVIKHWRIHNYIQKDRYQPTKYIEEMALLKVKNNGGYTLDTECIQNGDTGKVRLGKVTAEQSSEKLKSNQENDMSWNKIADDFEEELQVDPDYVPKGKAKSVKKVSDDVQEVFNLFSNPAKVTWRLREIERVAAQALFDTYGLETLKKRIDRIEKEKGNKDPLFPLVVTPSQLLDKMPNVERYFGI